MPYQVEQWSCGKENLDHEKESWGGNIQTSGVPLQFNSTELNCKENQSFGRYILMGTDVKKSLFLQPCSQIGLSQQVKLFQRHMSYHNSPLFPLEGELFLMKLLQFQIIIIKMSKIVSEFIEHFLKCISHTR